MIPPLYIAARVKVARNEMTCTVCGEVTNQAYCMRCNEEIGVMGKKHAQVAAKRGRMVPTVSYLRDGEYEVTA